MRASNRNKFAVPALCREANSQACLASASLHSVFVVTHHPPIDGTRTTSFSDDKITEYPTRMNRAAQIFKGVASTKTNMSSGELARKTSA